MRKFRPCVEYKALISSADMQLKRHIGLTFLVLYGVGDILGAGVYGLVGKAAGEMGYAVWLAFLTSMIAAGLTGLSYASLGSRFPKAAGASHITMTAFNNQFLSYMIGLAIAASSLTSMATAVRIFSGYFTSYFNFINFSTTMVLFSLIVAFVIFRGIKETMWMNAVCTLTEVSGLLFIIFVGIPYLGEVSYFNAQTEANPAGTITLPLLLSGAVLTFYSFIGFEDILNISEEIKDPERTLPLGLILSVAISSVIYMLISLVAVSVIPPTELSASKQPLVDVAAKAAPWLNTSVFSFIAMFAVMNTFLLNFTMGSRLFYGMAKQGLLPQILGKLHSTRKTPHIAILAIFIILMILAFSGDVTGLARATSVILLISFFVINVSLITFKLKKYDWKGCFQVPLFIPILGCLVCLAMVTQAQKEEAIISIILLGIIALLYFILRPKKLY